MSSSCGHCGRVLVRHLRFPVTLRDHLGWDGPLPEDWTYWDSGEWKSMAPHRRERFWLPITNDLTHEEGMVLYAQWVREAKETKEELVVCFVDLGLVKGRDEDPWLGGVLLGAFRGHGLDCLDPGASDDMLWLTRAYLCAADSQAKFKTYRQLGLM